MRYDLNNDIQLQQARTRFDFLVKSGVVVDLIHVRKKRTIKQNAYLHLVLSWFALEYGETLEYTKQIIFKQWVNKDVFLTEYVNRKTGEIRETYKSTKDLDTKELTVCIDRFRNYSSKEMGLYLPEPNDLVFLNQISNEIENNRQYL